MKGSSLRLIRSGALVGFIDVELPSGMIVRDLAVFASNGKRWVSLSKPMIGSDAVAKRDEKGRIVYTQLLSFRDKTTADSFRHQVLAEVDRLITGSGDGSSGSIDDDASAFRGGP
jgi:hypothetical protein